MAEDYNDRFVLLQESEITRNTSDAIYTVIETESGCNYVFDDPDFRFIQFRANLVARWEFLPGSTLYLVWTQEKTDYATISNTYELMDNARDMFDIHPHNAFLIKVSYLFNN